MSFRDKAIGVAQKVMQGGAVRSFFGFFNGKCTFFAIVFSIAGVYGWLVLGRDLSSFAMFAGAILSLLTAHSVKEDYFQNQAQQQSTTVVNNITMSPTADKPAS